ncbi:hypothetical protein FSP39_001065 [Pinctada imbricata]|uniref:RRM domain-containing protein n=1 Tax=Pinctada imbricata TaxID=66713 RepID=A0AA88Y1C5_PINIB|nr:hypothetical protein FSP39_001065 [Pinctada imbricata]
MEAKTAQNKGQEGDIKKEQGVPNKSNEEGGQKKDMRGGFNNRGGRGGGGRGGGGRGGQNPNRGGGNMPGRGGRGGRGGGPGRDDMRNMSNQSFTQFGDYINPYEEMQQMYEGPKEKRKFTGRCRLFVGNITPDTTEEQFKEMFKPYGEVGEIFVNASKGFGFIRLDYRHNAEAAKSALDGTVQNGRMLRVRYANHGAAVKVTNLSPYVSNELLEQAFTQFGDIERAIVVTDDKGRSLCEGIVEFARKPAVQQCLRRVNEGVLLMSSYPRPVRVEVIEARDDEDGLAERYLPRNEMARRDREKEPRFAPIGTFENRFAQKYREIDDLEKQQIERVKQEMDQQRHNLESEMEGAIYDYQAEQIRADLMRQQEELRRLEEMKNEQMRRRQEMEARREEEMRMIREDEDRRREILMRSGGGGGGRGMESRGMGMREADSPRGNNSSLPPPPAPPAALGFENPSEGFGRDGGNQEDNMGGWGQAGMFGRGGMGARPGGDMGMDRRRQAGMPGGREDFDMKRMRRF